MTRAALLKPPTRWVVPILLLASALRLFNLDAQSMWFDEAARLLIAQAPLEAILSNAGRDTLPPFFHLTIHAWNGFGSSDFWLRLPAAFASIISVAVVYRLGYSIFSRSTALIAALIMAILPYQIFQAQQANLYSYLALFSGLQILFFYLAVTRNHLVWWLGYTLVVIGGMYTHYFSAFLLLTLHLWLLIINISQGSYRGRWPRLLIANGLAGLLFLPQLATFIRETGVVTTDFWLTKPGPAAPLVTMHLFTVSYSLPAAIVPVGFLLTIALITIALLDLFQRYRKQSAEKAKLLLIVMLTFLPNIAVFLIAQFTPIYLERTLIILTPAYCVFLARALSTTHRKSPLPYLAGLTACVATLSLIGYYSNPDFAKPDYRQAAEFVAAQVEEGQAVLHTGNGSYLPFLLYRKPADHFLLAGDPAPHHPPNLHQIAGGRTVSLENLAGYDQVWLVTALDHSQEYQRGIIADFDAQFPLLLETSVDDIIIRQYSLSSLQE